LPYEKGVELADALKPLAPGGLTMAQMAQRWILDYGAVSVVIPGASRPDQARANADVSKLPPLNAKVHDTLQNFYEREVAAHIRGPY
jgi:aryl-alcohol dehydrogenase-like predicted oxidoreductase